MAAAAGLPPISGAFVDVSAFTGTQDSLFFIQRLETRLQPPDRAVLWFELDVPTLRTLFLHEGMEGAAVTIAAADGTPLLRLGDALPDASLVYNEQGMADLGDYRFIAATIPPAGARDRPPPRCATPLLATLRTWRRLCWRCRSWWG